MKSAGRKCAFIATLAVMGGGTAHATEGYFQNGTSVRDKGIAGAGSADPMTPLIIASNPAGIAEIDSQVEVGASVFSPRRQFEGTGGPGFTPSGTVKSGRNYFALPNLGYTHRLDDKSAFGLALYGNGGMNTSYGAPANPACASPPLPAPNGVYCGGKTGVDLMQVYVTAGYARQIGDNITVGVAPMLAFQLFKADGLRAFTYDMSGNPLTVDTQRLTDNDYSTSTGVGARVGVLFKLAPQFRVGLSYSTEMKMSRFKKYAGLFEDGGKFDIPSSFTAGVALDATPQLKLMGDYRHIWYSDVPAVSNPSTVPQQFGSKGGPGFGWKDVDAFKLGAEYQASPTLTLRAGAAFNNNPVRSQDVTLNILAPGVSKQHYTAGMRLKTGDRSAFDLSFLYSPDGSTRGIEVTPAGPNPGHFIELKMHQFELGLAWTHRL